MKPSRSDSASVDAYIATFPADVQVVLRQIRKTIKAAAPDAEERISYQMPAYFQNGVLAYFGGFKKHIGLFPPVADAALAKEAAHYAGPKGNLQLPLSQPMPLDLIARIVRARLAVNLAKKR
ncbi:MAG: DUF1801 domain-containing protein [Gemmatimonadaceae bacterium]|nr:DUF1801 domain-containing protein [Gemmatimonadaceae bacterium]